MSLSFEFKSIVASNLTTALSNLVASGKDEMEAMKTVMRWYKELYPLVPLSLEPKGESLFPGMK